MHDSVIVAHPSSTSQFIDLLQGALALGEDVKGEWFLSIVDEGNGLIQAVHGDDGEKGTKDLLL